MKNARDTLKDNIKYYLELRGISKKDFAAALGVSASSVTNWIKGKNSPDIENIAQMCRILNVSINDLIGVETSEKSALEIKLIQNYNALDFLGKTELLNYSHYLLDKQTSNTEKKQA